MPTTETSHGISPGREHDRDVRTLPRHVTCGVRPTPRHASLASRVYEPPQRLPEVGARTVTRAVGTPSPTRDDSHDRDLRDSPAKMNCLDAHRRGGLGMQFEGPTAAGLMYSDTGGDGPVVLLLHHPLPAGARHHDRGVPHRLGPTPRHARLQRLGRRATRHQPRRHRSCRQLVLVSCEAFDNYPPGVPGRLLCLNAALPGGTFPCWPGKLSARISSHG